MPRPSAGGVHAQVTFVERGLFTWDGNYYALNLSERLGVERSGGMLRIGLVHYNTAEEVDRLLASLHELRRSGPLPSPAERGES